MVYGLSNMCVKNLCKRTVLVQFIIKNVVTCFSEHNVVDLLHYYIINVKNFHGSLTTVVRAQNYTSKSKYH